MGYIRILKSNGSRILLDSSMTYLILLDKETIKHIKVEKLINFIRENGQEITWEKLKQLELKLKEDKQKWWENYRKNFSKNKKGGEKCSQESK